MTIESIRTLIGYHHALTRQVWESIAQLTEEQFLEEVPYSHGSVRNHMVHVAQTDARWLRGLQGDPTARSLAFDPAAFPTHDSARTLWEQGAAELAAYVEGLDEATLHATAPYLRGPTWQVLAHLVNHGTDHRAQVLRLLHDFGAPTFDQDLITHLWFPGQ